MQESNEFKFSSIQLIAFFLKWWKHILIATFIGAIGSAGFSLLLKNRYKSTVIFYATTTNSISNTLLNFGSNRKDFLEFGDEDDAEQALQILQSDVIRSRIIQQFDLWEHYDIDRNSNYALTKMYNRFKKNVQFRRTEYNSVEITVLDTDPQMAADMANAVAAQLDTVKNQVQQQRANEALKIVDEKFQQLSADVKMLSDSLTKLRKLGVNDVSVQTEMYTEQLAIAISKNNTKAISDLQERLDVLSEHASAFMEMTNKIILYTEQLALVKLKREETQIDAEKIVPQKMVIDYATPADRKTFPKRSMIVAGATFATFCLTIFILIGLENWRRYKDSIRKAVNA